MFEDYLDIFKPFRCCVFCGGRKNLLRIVKECYCDELIYYHEKCFDDVKINPEMSGHKKVDWACCIWENISREKSAIENRKNRRENNIKKLKEN